MKTNDAIKNFIREKGKEYRSEPFLYSGYDWNSGVSIKNGGDKYNEDYQKVKYYKPHSLNLSTGELGQVVNSKLVGDFLARPKSVGDGKLGRTIPMLYSGELGRTIPMLYSGENKLPEDDLEIWK